MLRFILFLLLLANGLYYAWFSGYLSQWGWSPPSQRESYRLNEQISPERIVVLSSNRPANNAILPATTQSPTPTQPSPSATTATIATTTQSQFCLTAGTFTDKQSATLKQTLASKIPELQWRFENTVIPAKWIVYMGKYPNNQMRDVKKTQLDQINVKYELLTSGSLVPGLSLGSFTTQADANSALQSLEKKGVHTARVLQESPEQKALTWIAPSVDEASRTKLNAVYATLSSQLSNAPLRICN